MSPWVTDLLKHYKYPHASLSNVAKADFQKTNWIQSLLTSPHPADASQVPAAKGPIQSVPQVPPVCKRRLFVNKISLSKHMFQPAAPSLCGSHRGQGFTLYIALLTSATPVSVWECVTDLCTCMAHISRCDKELLFLKSNICMIAVHMYRTCTFAQHSVCLWVSFILVV